MLFETLSVVVYFHAVFTSIVIWKVLTCTVSNALDQFPYLHTLHVTWKPAYLWKTFQNAMHASFLHASLLLTYFPLQYIELGHSRASYSTEWWQGQNKIPCSVLGRNGIVSTACY